MKLWNRSKPCSECGASLETDLPIRCESCRAPLCQFCAIHSSEHRTHFCRECHRLLVANQPEAETTEIAAQIRLAHSLAQSPGQQVTELTQLHRLPDPRPEVRQ